MTDPYTGLFEGRVDYPASSFGPVTPSDGTPFAVTPKALFVGGAGNLIAKGSDGTSATFAVAAGQILPIRPQYVMATGTTATGIVALY